VTRAVVITGGPGTGKTSVLGGLALLLDNAGIEHAALETEVLGWGHPWLADALAYEQLAAIVPLQRGFGRRLHLVTATTETEADLRGVVAALAAERTLVACTTAPGEVAAARILAREPEAWAGREPLAAHARVLADRIPRLPGIDLHLDTDGRDHMAVAAELRDALATRGLI
jgi:hypothetical protein